MDPVTAGVLAATVIPLASGAAGEAGRQAWSSLLAVVRRRFGGDAPAIEGAVAVGDTVDIESVVGEIVRLAEHDAEFAQWLGDWTTDAAPLARGHNAVTNTVGGQAEISGGLVQAHTINGPLTFGGTPPAPRAH